MRIRQCRKCDEDINIDHIQTDRTCIVVCPKCQESNKILPSSSTPITKDETEILQALNTIIHSPILKPKVGIVRKFLNLFKRK